MTAHTRTAASSSVADSEQPVSKLGQIVASSEQPWDSSADTVSNALLEAFVRKLAANRNMSVLDALPERRQDYPGVMGRPLTDDELRTLMQEPSGPAAALDRA